jgi:tRNA(fMet)-specific endonuclease VapC
MPLILLDTDVFSYFFKRDSRAALYQQYLLQGQPSLSFQTVAEVRYWALVRHWGKARKDSLADTIGRYLILPYDEAMSRHWAEISAQRRQMGREIGCGDAWIASTALRHDAMLLSHNAKDFAGIRGLKLVSHGS